MCFINVNNQDQCEQERLEHVKQPLNVLLINIIKQCLMHNSEGNNDSDIITN